MVHTVDFPPITVNTQGDLRRVGFEFEYTGIPLDETARVIAKLFGGEAREESHSHYTVHGTRHGDFSVKLDMSLMQRISAEAARQREEDSSQETLETVAERLLSPVVSAWMPNEIVTPPFPLDALAEVDALCRTLRRQGAKGTGASPVYAFGLHINPDMPDIAPERLKDYLAAFVLLQDWLKEKTRMNITRQLTTFAKAFSTDYARLLLSEAYAPDFATLVDDYLIYNPTRNRALDMLPLFAFLDEKRVRRAVDDERVRPRPTFHYRLPNCDIDNPRWSVPAEWNLWVQVERLAEDHERRRAMAKEYLAWTESPLNTLLGNWSKEAESWMKQPVTA